MSHDQGAATRKSLLLLLREGDTDAWRQCVALYAPLVMRWCHRQGLTGPDADDVAQNVFLAVVQGLDRFRKEAPDDSFRGWLARITHRRIADWRQQRADTAQPRGGSEALLHLQELPTPLQTPAEVQEETRYLYQSAIGIIRGEFSERDWQIVMRLTVDGRSAPEVADEFGAAAATVRQIKSRIVRRIKQTLGDVPD